MQFNKEEFDTLKDKKKQQQRVVNMEAIRAAPEMEVLTNSEEWNKYLSYLVPLVNNAEKRLKDITAQLVNPSIFEAEKLFYLKGEHIKMTERVEVIKTLMTFPKQIIEYGKIMSNPLASEEAKKEEI